MLFFHVLLHRFVPCSTIYYLLYILFLINKYFSSSLPPSRRLFEERLLPFFPSLYNKSSISIIVSRNYLRETRSVQESIDHSSFFSYSLSHRKTAAMRTTTILLLLSTSFLVSGSPIAQFDDLWIIENPKPVFSQQMSPFDAPLNTNIPTVPISPTNNQPNLSSPNIPISPNNNQPNLPSPSIPIAPFTCNPQFPQHVPGTSIVTGLEQACCSDTNCVWYDPANIFCSAVGNFRCCEDVYHGAGQACTTTTVPAQRTYEPVEPESGLIPDVSPIESPQMSD